MKSTSSKVAATKPESRMASAILLRITKTDRKQLKALARKRKMPMATLAYQTLREMLDAEYSDGGAQ